MIILKQEQRLKYIGDWDKQKDKILPKKSEYSMHDCLSDETTIIDQRNLTFSSYYLYDV